VRGNYVTATFEGDVEMRCLILFSVITLCLVGQLEADLVAHWGLEGDGVDSTGSHDGTIYGNPATVAGQVGQALDFDGNDYIDVPHHADLTPSDAMTVSAWFKPASFNMGSYSWPAILKKANNYEPSGFTMEIQQVYESTPKISFIVVNSSGGNESPDVFPVTTDTWYFYAGVYEYNSGTDQSTLTTYFGPDFQSLQQSNVTTFDGPIKHTTENLNIGRDNSYTQSSRYFDGIIDDVRFYDEALTETEVNDLYAAVPEPSTVVMLIAGLIGVLVIRRRGA
jgi:Concanavalin A-like lectin/glucanases superfamily/PEP-CTERM motif